MKHEEKIRLPDEIILIEPPEYGWPWSSAIFAVRDEKGCTLIEVGCGGEKAVKHTLSSLHERGVAPGTVHTILISHAHPDHYGAIRQIIEIHPEAEIVIHENELAAASGIEGLYRNFDFHLGAKYTGSRGPDLDFAIEQRKQGIFMDACHAGAHPPHRTAADGEITAAGPLRLKWMLTPGHSPGHTVFYDSAHGLLFSGDLVGKHPAWYAPTAGGVSGYLAGLDAIAALRPAVLLPSHGRPVTDPQKIISSIRDKLIQREDRILDMLSEGPSSFRRIVAALFPDHYRLFPGCPIVESHLLKLAGEGKIVESDNAYALS